MTLVLDAGALFAIDRADVRVVRLLEAERRAGRVPVTHGGIVGQVWRDGAKQARLAHLLSSVTVVPLDDARGRRAGLLLARTRTDDVHDAAVVLLAADGDTILTSEVGDLVVLAKAHGAHVDIVPV